MNNNKKKTIIFVTLLIVIACLIIGYALLSTTLNILGDTSVKGNSWDIHWENIQVTEGSTTENTKEAIITSQTQVEFSISLDKPGDFYEFTVEAVNDGTIDGMIDVISTNVYQSNGTTPTTLPSAITYSITYDDDTPLERYQMLSADSYETYKIRVEYKRDIENSELITTNQTYVMKIGITYIQSDENAVDRPIPGVLPNYNEDEGCATINTDSTGGGGNANMSGLTLMMKNATQGEDNPSWFTATAESQSQAGVYTRQGTSNDKYPIYYYRGAYGSVNNNLIFNNYCWKIVRTTATGGVRIIYNGPTNNGQCTTQTGPSTIISQGAFNISYNDSKYVGYMYDNNGTQTSSNLKTTLETWYNSNMSNVDNKIERSVYCNDKSEMTMEERSTLGINTDTYIIYYCPTKRNYTSSPTTICSKKSDAYKLKVGFLTLDEALLSGYSKNGSMTTYLYNSEAYWLGSPFSYDGSSAGMYVMVFSGYGIYGVDGDMGIRPVVTLKPNTNYTGSGTTTNPFVVN